MKLNTVVLKKILVEKIKKDPNTILRHVVSEDIPTVESVMDKIVNIKNWKLEEKGKNEDGIWRSFIVNNTGFEDFDEILSFYVETDEKDLRIKRCWFVG